MKAPIHFPDKKTRFTLICFLITVGCLMLINGCGNSEIPDGLADSDVTLSSGLSCTECHGNSENAAPPMSVNSEYDTSSVSVGAHQSHLHDGILKKALACEQCHLVPTRADQDGHMDESPAEITWGTLAGTGNTAPLWDRTLGTCSNVYCHGATLSGGTNKIPTWTIVNDTQAACGTCHGNPPTEAHPAANQCQACHSGTVDQDGRIDVAGGLHIDGIIQVDDTESPSSRFHPEDYAAPSQHGFAFNKNKDNCKGCHGDDYTGGSVGVSCDSCHGGSTWRTDCTFCHGGQDNDTGAPPLGLYDDPDMPTSTTDLHSRHIENQGLSITPCGLCHKSLDCTYCHIKPLSFDDPGHIDGNQGSEVFISSASGINAVYTNADRTCSSVGCHSGNPVQWVSPEDQTEVEPGNE
ncbi:MAG: CxxxxCH/CxxCH domain-containing protein [Proteobacteria bacterium]|nr:CxxxxCH/CxxCH domain-containing protein [Pseudomonadota bacterium]